MDFGPKNFREIDLVDLTSFFGLDFFKFSGLENNPEIEFDLETNFYEVNEIKIFLHLNDFWLLFSI